MAIQSDQEFVPSQIARATFPTAFRGYDQDAVRRFLSRLAAELEHQQEYAELGNLEARTPAHNRVEELESEIESLNEEIRDLEVELVQRSLSVDDETASKAERTEDGALFGERAASSPSTASDGALDESRAIEFLGQETARVLESARSAASDILKRAEGQARAMERQAREHLDEARARSEALVADKQAKIEALVDKLESEAEAAAQQMRSEAEEHHAMVLEESAKIMLEAESSGEAERERSQERAREIVADAETLRQQVVAELIVERREASQELEQMGAARDRVAMSLSVARSELESIAADLERSSLPVFQPGFASKSSISLETSTGNEGNEGNESNDGDELAEFADGGPSNQAKHNGALSDADPTTETPLDSMVETDEDRTTLFEDNAVGHNDDITREVDVSGGADVADSGTKSNGSQGAHSGETTSAKGKPEAKSDPNSGSGKRSNKKSAKRSQAAANKRNNKSLSQSKRGLKDGSSSSSKSTSGTNDSNGSGTTDLGNAFDTGRDQFDEILDDLGIEPKTAETVTEEPASKDPISKDPVSKDTANKGTDVERLDDPDGAPEPDIDLTDGGGDSSAKSKSKSESKAESKSKKPKAKTAQAMAMVDGFTTIDLGEESLDLEQFSVEEPEAVDAGAAGDVQHSVIVSEPESPESIITTVAARSATATITGNRGDIELDEPAPGKAPAVFSARDLALTRFGPDFRRQLRRALNDDQSDVLDRLRAGRRTIEVSELPAFGDQIDRYLNPLRRSLGEVAQAGSAAGGQSELSPRALDNLVRQLAKFIVDQVRIPTIEAVTAAEDDDREKILEPIRAIYRDFRNGALSGLTDDALYESFAIGLYESIEPVERLSWLIDPRTDPDPVCEINAAVSDVVKGMTFPSGHSRPLAMPGCRCLVISADF